MSREIRFRAFDKRRRKYAYRILKYGARKWFVLARGILRFDWGDGFILEQYTGLRDKNGKEIYEGDLVRMYDAIFITKWRDQDFSYIFSRPEVFYWLNIGRSSDCEVIGNIHENSELLNDRKGK